MRLVWRFEWLTLYPDAEVFPQISHFPAKISPLCRVVVFWYYGHKRRTRGNNTTMHRKWQGAKRVARAGAGRLASVWVV